MYSRYEKSREGIRLPAHYGGSAFSNNKATAPKPLAPPPYTPPVTKQPPEPPPPVCPPPSREAPLVAARGEDDRALKAGFPFLHGLGFEELLIMGMILLISQGENAADTVFWLTLLLLCG